MIKKILLAGAMLFAVVGIVRANDLPPFQEEGAMWRMWDEIPPEYSDTANYYVNGTPGGVEEYTYRYTYDFVDFGDLESEAGHDVLGWGEPWDGLGNYGGADDGTFRTVIPKLSLCTSDDKIADFKMYAPAESANYLRLRHLFGSQNDGYRLYVKDEEESWVELTVQSSVDEVCVGGECWYTEGYELGDKAGKNSEFEFRIEATLDPIPSWCTLWGLNAFSWAELSQVSYE